MKLPSIFNLLCHSLWAFMVALIVACLCVGCTSQRVVTEAHSTTRVDTVVQYHDRVVFDTVRDWRADSAYISHTMVQHGDTVHIRDTVFKFKTLKNTEYKTEYLHDSIFVHDSVFVSDSIPYEVQVIKYARKRNWYDKFTSAAFWIIIALLAVFIGVRIIARRI